MTTVFLATEKASKENGQKVSRTQTFALVSHSGTGANQWFL